MALVLSSYSYYYLIAGIINFTVLSFLLVLLIIHFFRKRTVGTFLLIMTYASVWINEILVTLAFYLEGLYPGNENYLKAAQTMQMTGVFFLVYTINWMYFFANRHLIRDNDLFKLLYTSIFGAFVGVAGGLAYYDIYTGDRNNPFWYSIIELAGADFNLNYPPTQGLRLILIGGMFAIGSITYLRLIVRTTRLTRKAKDVVTKKGLRIVSLSILFLWLTGLVLALYVFGANRIPWLSVLVYLFRGMIVITAVILGYLGWIMPEWLRRRLRGKAWIAKVYTGKLPEPPKSKENIEKAPRPITSPTSANQVVEISEQ